jgi:hypothetical protein
MFKPVANRISITNLLNPLEIVNSNVAPHIQPAHGAGAPSDSPRAHSQAKPKTAGGPASAASGLKRRYEELAADAHAPASRRAAPLWAPAPAQPLRAMATYHSANLEPARHQAVASEFVGAMPPATELATPFIPHNDDKLVAANTLLELHTGAATQSGSPANPDDLRSIDSSGDRQVQPVAAAAHSGTGKEIKRVSDDEVKEMLENIIILINNRKGTLDEDLSKAHSAGRIGDDSTEVRLADHNHAGAFCVSPVDVSSKHLKKVCSMSKIRGIDIPFQVEELYQNVLREEALAELKENKKRYEQKLAGQPTLGAGDTSTQRRKYQFSPEAVKEYIEQSKLKINAPESLSKIELRMLGVAYNTDLLKNEFPGMVDFYTEAFVIATQRKNEKQRINKAKAQAKP